MIADIRQFEGLQVRADDSMGVQSDISVFNGQTERDRVRQLLKENRTEENAREIILLVWGERQEWGEVRLERKLPTEKEREFQDYRQLEQELRGDPDLLPILFPTRPSSQSVIESIFGST